MLLNVVDLNDHHLSNRVIHPIGKNEAIHQNMGDFPSVSIRSGIVRQEKRVIG